MRPSDPVSEPPLVTLARWEAAGAHWRVRLLTADRAEVDLLSCMGEQVDHLRSSDPDLLAYLARRPNSADGPA